MILTSIDDLGLQKILRKQKLFSALHGLIFTNHLKIIHTPFLLHNGYIDYIQLTFEWLLKLKTVHYYPDFYFNVFGTRLVPLLCTFFAFSASLNALLVFLQPFFNKLYSNAAALPPVIALAKRALPHECAV